MDLQGHGGSHILDHRRMKSKVMTTWPRERIVFRDGVFWSSRYCLSSLGQQSCFFPSPTENGISDNWASRGIGLKWYASRELVLDEYPKDPGRKSYVYIYGRYSKQEGINHAMYQNNAIRKEEHKTHRTHQFLIDHFIRFRYNTQYIKKKTTQFAFSKIKGKTTLDTTH